MPNKAKYTISGNEACKTFVTSTVLMKGKVSIIEGYGFLQCDVGNKETFRR
jgi:hypothetical protein